MPEEREKIQKSTKKHGKELKTKKRRKSTTAEHNHDLCEGLQRSSPPVTKLELTGDSTLTPKVGDQPSSKTSSALSRKRKRTNPDALLDESVHFETDTTKLEPSEDKKRDERRAEDRVPYPDPAIDESLSEQSRKALSYAYEQCQGIKHWKFNKARQNWLLRNVWSEQAVPDNYIPLVIGYLAGIRGGAREKLTEECVSKTSESTPTEVGGTGDQASDDRDIGIMINRPTNTLQSRALSILQALRKN